MRQVVVRRAAVLAVALAAAGCGGDDGSGAPVTTGDGPVLEVGARDDLAFDQDAYEVGAGEVEVVYRNEGSIAHTLLFDGVDDFKLQVGDVDTGTVALDPGSYRMYCDLPGHEAAGMVAEVTVE